MLYRGRRSQRSCYRREGSHRAEPCLPLPLCPPAPLTDIDVLLVLGVQGSYSASISVDVAPVGGLIFVAVEKDNVVYAAVRTTHEGRIQYYNTTVRRLL